MRPEIKLLPYRGIEPPFYVQVRPILAINQNFDPSNTKDPWESGVVTYGEAEDKYKGGTYSPDDKDIPADRKDNWLKLMQMESQLEYEEDYVRYFSKEFLWNLECGALLLDIARRYEDWAFKMRDLFKDIDKSAAEHYLQTIYILKVSNKYSQAEGALTKLAESFTADFSIKTKNAWAPMLLYAANKNYAIQKLYLPSYDERDPYREQIYVLLRQHGFEHLIPAEAQPPETKNSRSQVLFSTVSSLVAQATGLIYGSKEVSGLKAGSAIDLKNLHESLVERYNPKTTAQSGSAENYASELLTQIQDNLAFYNKVYLNTALVEKESRQQNTSFLETTKFNFSQYLNPCILRIIEIFKTILAHPKVIISRYELSRVLENVKKVHGNVQKLKLPITELGGLNQDQHLNQEFAIIQQGINGLAKPLSQISEKNQPAFDLRFIDPNYLDKFEESLIKDSHNLVKFKKDLDEAIAAKSSINQIKQALNNLNKKVSLFLTKIEEYYSYIDNREQMQQNLNATKQSMAQHFLFIPKITIALAALENQSKDISLPTINSDRTTAQVTIAGPEIHPLTAPSFPYELEPTLEHEKINIKFKLESLTYIPPIITSQTPNIEDLEIMRAEIELNVWFEAMYKAINIGDAAFKLTENPHDFEATWNIKPQNSNVFDYMLKKDSCLPICHSYIRLSMSFNDLLAQVRERYNQAGINSEAIIRQMVEKYTPQLEKGFIWLEAAIRLRAINPPSKAKIRFLELIGASNIGYINLIPENCLVLRKRMYENYPRRFNNRFGHLKEIIRDISHNEMLPNERELLITPVSLSDKNSISNISFDLKTISSINPEYDKVIDFNRRLGKFKFRIANSLKELTPDQKEILKEEARCAIFENHLIDAYRDALVANDAAAKHAIGIQFYRIALVFECLRNALKPEDEQKRKQLDSLICEKLMMAFDAISDALLTNKVKTTPSKSQVEDTQEIAKTLARYMEHGVGREYLIGGVLLETELSIDKLNVFRESYRMLNFKQLNAKTRNRLV